MRRVRKTGNVICYLFDTNLSSGEIITLGTWSALELDIGVICACLPSVQVLFKYCGGRQSLSQASSGFVELDSPGGKTAFSGGKNSAGSRGAAVPHIRRTTAITQQTLTGSEAHLSLDPRPSQGCDIELGSRRKGDGTSQV